MSIGNAHGLVPDTRWLADLPEEWRSKYRKAHEEGIAALHQVALMLRHNEQVSPAEIITRDKEFVTRAVERVQEYTRKSILSAVEPGAGSRVRVIDFPAATPLDRQLRQVVWSWAAQQLILDEFAASRAAPGAPIH